MKTPKRIFKKKEKSGYSITYDYILYEKYITLKCTVNNDFYNCEITKSPIIGDVKNTLKELEKLEDVLFDEVLMNRLDSIKIY